jgi:signal transduction histidine kinase
VQAKRSGLGLIGLRERVEALSGRLLLDAKPGAGVEIVAMIPVPKGASEHASETEGGEALKHI